MHALVGKQRERDGAIRLAMIGPEAAPVPRKTTRAKRHARDVGCDAVAQVDAAR